MTADNVHGVLFAEAAAAHVALNFFILLLVLPDLDAFAHVLGQ